MTDYSSNLSIEEAAGMLATARRVVITTHAKPDGDACGSVAALAGVLRARGAKVMGVLSPPVPANLQFMVEGEPSMHVGPDRGNDAAVTAAVGDADLVVILDTGAWSQLTPLRAVLNTALERTLIVDHHLSGDVAAKYRYIDGRAAAVCEIVADLIERVTAGAALSPAVCQALFVGVAADTGWFRFSNTRAQSHELAARLLRRGVDQAELYRKLEQNERPAKLALLARAVQSLSLMADNRAAVMVLRAGDFAQTGALIEETEQLVDLPRAVGSVQVVALIVEPPGTDHVGAVTPAHHDRPGHSREADRKAIRVSFRSKPGPHAIDVSALAQRFGGGGHARAAGAKVAEPLEQVVEQVTAAMLALFAAG
jgi:phosphoesterase RecJ-like protein